MSEETDDDMERAEWLENEYHAPPIPRMTNPNPPPAPRRRDWCEVCRKVADHDGVVDHLRSCTIGEPKPAPGPAASPTPPLPTEVEAALEEMGCDCGKKGCADWVNSQTLRAHLRQQAERIGELESISKAKSSTISALCDTADETERQAEQRGRLEGLEWARDIITKIGRGAPYLEYIEAELARLRAESNG